MDGTVIDVRVFTRDGVEKDKRALSIEKMEIERVTQGLRRPAPHPRGRRSISALRAQLRRQGRQRRPERPEEGRDDHRRVPRRAAEASEWFEIRMKDEDANDAARAARRSSSKRTQQGSSSKRFEDKQAKITAGRRPRPGRAQDGEGVPGREAPRAAGRQDGRPPRQQGRDLDDRSGRGHAVHGRRHAGRHRAESAGRAFAHEHRPGARNASGLGREGPGPEDRPDARRRRPRSRELRKFLDQIYNHDRRPDSASTSSSSTTRSCSRSRSNLTDGVPMATPVFDGAAEDEIKAMLEARGSAASGQTHAVSTAAPARRSIARSRSATCTC